MDGDKQTAILQTYCIVYFTWHKIDLATQLIPE